MDFLDSTFSANVWLTSHKHPKYNHDKSTHYQITSKASRNHDSTPKKNKEKKKKKKKKKKRKNIKTNVFNQQKIHKTIFLLQKENIRNDGIWANISLCWLDPEEPLEGLNQEIA